MPACADMLICSLSWLRTPLNPTDTQYLLRKPFIVFQFHSLGLLATVKNPEVEITPFPTSFFISRMFLTSEQDSLCLFF